MVTMTIERLTPEGFSVLEQEIRLIRALREYAPHLTTKRQSELVAFGGEFVMPGYDAAAALQEELNHYDVRSYWVYLWGQL